LNFAKSQGINQENTDSWAVRGVLQSTRAGSEDAALADVPPTPEHSCP